MFSPTRAEMEMLTLQVLEGVAIGENLERGHAYNKAERETLQKGFRSVLSFLMVPQHSAYLYEFPLQQALGTYFVLALRFHTEADAATLRFCASHALYCLANGLHTATSPGERTRCYCGILKLLRWRGEWLQSYEAEVAPLLAAADEAFAALNPTAEEEGALWDDVAYFCVQALVPFFQQQPELFFLFAEQADVTDLIERASNRRPL